MNADQLLDAFGHARDHYVSQALGEPAQKKTLSLRKPLLLAAIAALMLLLAGCTAAVVLHLQNMKIAQKPLERYYNDEGKYTDPTEVTMDVISLRGYGGSPNHLATRAWYEFEQSYDQDHALLWANDDNQLGIPDGYAYPYSCYTWEMVDKVDEIAQTYGLKLLSPGILVQRWQSAVMLEALGLESVTHEGAVRNVGAGSGYFYPEGNFNYSFEFLLPGEDDWPFQLWATMLYSKKDYFDPDYTFVDTERYDQWHYTTADGTDVLIALNGGAALLFAEQEDAYLNVSINAAAMTPQSETRAFTREDAQKAADAIDFTIRPQLIDMSTIQDKLLKADRDHEEALAEAEGKAREGYGSYLDYVYENYVAGAEQLAGTPFVRNYYALADVTGDGEDELLLGSEDDHFRDILTIEDGAVKKLVFWHHMNLCRDNVIRITSYGNLANEPVGYIFFRGGELHDGLDYLEYAQEEGTWKQLRFNKDLGAEILEPITSQELQAILDKYPLADLQMHPIREFPGLQDYPKS